VAGIIAAFTLAAMLRCQPVTIPDWKQALLYGDLIGYHDYMIDSHTRHTMTVLFRKRLLLFVFMYREEPGALEPGAWHGCGMYQIGEYFP
jgi:hypothetical protein